MTRGQLADAVDRARDRIAFAEAYAAHTADLGNPALDALAATMRERAATALRDALVAYNTHNLARQREDNRKVVGLW